MLENAVFQTQNRSVFFGGICGKPKPKPQINLPSVLDDCTSMTSGSKTTLRSAHSSILPYNSTTRATATARCQCMRSVWREGSAFSAKTTLTRSPRSTVLPYYSKTRANTTARWRCMKNGPTDETGKKIYGSHSQRTGLPSTCFSASSPSSCVSLVAQGPTPKSSLVML